jgi:hypothetical protein
MPEIDETSAPAEDQAREQAIIVLTNLVDSLSKHFGIMKTQARAAIRQALMEV